jgi:S1-C subfamily serine protease
VRTDADGGLIPGDVIVAVEGKPVESVARLTSRLDDYEVGQTVHLTVLRQGRKLDVNVRLQPGNQ